jgi:hypothetical protein
MSANNQIARVYLTDIRRQLEELDAIVESAVYMTDSKEEIFILGTALLSKARQVLAPIVGIDQLEVMMLQYIQLLRNQANGSG